MKNNYFFSYAALIVSFLITNTVHADAISYTATTSMLEKTGNNFFKDHEGRLIYYPCSMGGEPLVIYSSLNNEPISSQSTIYPVYIKNGYQATSLMIPSFEASEITSRKDLIIKTINPASNYISISLRRENGGFFYIDTANAPVVNTTDGKEGKQEKYVSIFNVSINNSNKVLAFTDFPVYNYNFVESLGLYVYHYATEITVNVASWNQNSQWTDGIRGRNASNISYRFSPVKIKDGGMASYDGYGFWICGSELKQDEYKIGDQKFYLDKIRQ